MNKYLRKREMKFERNISLLAQVILSASFLASYILIMIWLFKLNKNSKNEPKSRSSYIIEKPETYYREDEFCYENFQPFINKGALKIFDLPIKKINIFSKALIITLFTSIFSLILGVTFFCIGKYKSHSNNCYVCLSAILLICFTLALILNLVFAIILVHYYSKGNYSDFEEFSRCRYLSRQFRKDYDFIFTVKNQYKTLLVIIMMIEILNFINLIYKSFLGYRIDDYFDEDKISIY